MQSATKLNELDELEKIVNLAESVSENISKLDNILFKVKLQLSLAMTLLYISGAGVIYLIKFSNSPDIITLILIIGLFIIMFTCMFYFIVILKEMKDTKYQLRSESTVITRLIEMIHSYKSSINDSQIDMLSSVVLEMRIGRIKFAAKDITKRFGDKMWLREK